MKNKSALRLLDFLRTRCGGYLILSISIARRYLFLSAFPSCKNIWGAGWGPVCKKKWRCYYCQLWCLHYTTCPLRTSRWHSRLPDDQTTIFWTMFEQEDLAEYRVCKWRLCMQMLNAVQTEHVSQARDQMGLHDSRAFWSWIICMLQSACTWYS